jgi:hypothetical protein
MDRSQTTGALIMAGGALQLLVFVIGLARKSYVALALPVTLAVAGISALAIWVGWTMMTTEADLSEPDQAAATA